MTKSQILGYINQLVNGNDGVVVQATNTKPEKHTEQAHPSKYRNKHS